MIGMGRRLRLLSSNSPTANPWTEQDNALIKCGLYNSMHAKQLIFDDEVVVIGSPNFTNQAEKNFEGVVVVREMTTLDDSRIHFDLAWVRASRVPFDELHKMAENSWFC